jgi:hypothetical protein
MLLIFSGTFRCMERLLPLLLFLYLPAGDAKTDPSFSWMTLTSSHFLIHYHQGEEALAQRTVVIAEDVHARLVPRMKSQPHDRTNIVLVDALDDANGWATPLPPQKNMDAKNWPTYP